MHQTTTFLPLFAIAISPFITALASAQSIRCVQEHFIAEFELDDQPSSYQILDNNTLAVLHQDTGEIRFYDPSVDGELTLRSSYPLYNTSNRTVLHANGNDIYVTVPQTDQSPSPYDLIVLNVQNPDQPTLRTTFTVFQSFDYAEFVDDTAYFMNNAAYDAGNSIYHAYDISNPNNPSLIHRINMGIRVDNNQGMQISNGVMHLSSSNRLMTYSVNELAQLQWLHTFNFGGDRVRAMEARDQRVFLYHAGSAPQPTFEIYNFSDPANPVQEFNTNVATTRQIHLDGQYAYLVGNEITAWNVLDPAAPLETATFTDYAFITDFLAHDGNLYVTRDSSVSIYDSQIRNLGRPEEIITPTGGQPTEMIVRDQLAYIANGSEGIAIYDVTEPMSPVFVNAVKDNLATITQIDANTNTLIAVNGNQLEIFSLEDPTAPTHRSSFEDGYLFIKDIAVENNLLAVMTDDPSTAGEKMVLYDISDPSAPVSLSTTQGFATSSWVEIYGDMVIAYDSSIPLNDQYTGLTSFDISDPTNPVYADKLIVASLARGAYQGGYLYVCSTDGFVVDDSTILVFDVSDPYNTVLVAEIPTGILPSEIAVQGNQLIVEANGLFLYDISNPLEPKRAGMAPRLPDPQPSGLFRPYIVADSIIGTRPDLGLVTYDASPCFTCVADMNYDGVLDFFDVSAFLAAYVESEPIADLNADTIIDFFDVSTFLVAYKAGCP